MEIIAWSLRYMWQGKHPETRYDGAAFTDTGRKNNAGKDLLYHACLVEVRGDWTMLAETFHLPRWNQKGGICWSCACKTDEMLYACMQAIQINEV